MKKIVLFIPIICFSLGVYSQKGSRERVKALKAAYITEQLNLSSKEAQQFWPLFNQFEETVRTLKKEEREFIRGAKGTSQNLDQLSEKQANDFLNQHLQNEEKKLKAKQKLIADLKKVMPNKKIVRLIKARADFNKRIIERMRERRKQH